VHEVNVRWLVIQLDLKRLEYTG